MIIVFVTAPKGKGEEIAKRILERRLAACINLVTVKSMYWWENKIVHEEEDLLIIKTRKDIFDKLSNFIKEIHPYKVPEIIALKASDVNIEYLSWIESETSLKKIHSAEK